MSGRQLLTVRMAAAFLVVGTCCSAGSVPVCMTRGREEVVAPGLHGTARRTGVTWGAAARQRRSLCEQGSVGFGVGRWLCVGAAPSVLMLAPGVVRVAVTRALDMMLLPWQQG